MRPRRMLGAAALLLIVGGVAACGDDDDSDTTATTEAGDDTPAEPSDDGQRDEYVDAIVAIGEEDDEDQLSAEDRRCVAEAYVDGFGAEAMAAEGVTPDDIGEVGAPGEIGLDFSDEQAGAFYEQLTGCMDLRALIVEEVLGAGSDPAPEVVACVDEAMTDDLLERFFVTGFTEGDAGFEGNPELENELNQALTPCLELAEG